ncbi:unnamed protein product [Bursaphelenchus okinawaensis]|uniref:Uncharacterized protein n=1 Tax=Bursaphelenchus okinawaensis TaxID=465554 RepID=A0A811LDW7_9BILA|nr:unnamed protein product [Bursaphelenchus okinawaensis]CAG9121222.1 unnamed protein product [Bursaphelenchus okinawaensis]
MAERKNSTVINWEQKSTARPKARSLNQLDTLISMCYRSVCKDWVDECHWFCEQIKGKNGYWRCMECLSSRGQHCFDCFEL